MLLRRNALAGAANLLQQRRDTGTLARLAGERDALSGYQATRDALSTALFDVTDVIAGHRWTDAEIPDLLLQLNAAMADELETLAALPPLPALVHAPC